MKELWTSRCVFPSPLNPVFHTNNRKPTMNLIVSTLSAYVPENKSQNRKPILILGYGSVWISVERDMKTLFHSQDRKSLFRRFYWVRGWEFAVSCYSSLHLLRHVFFHSLLVHFHLSSSSPSSPSQFSPHPQLPSPFTLHPNQKSKTDMRVWAWLIMKNLWREYESPVPFPSPQSDGSQKRYVKNREWAWSISILIWSSPDSHPRLTSSHPNQKPKTDLGAWAWNVMNGLWKF